MRKFWIFFLLMLLFAASALAEDALFPAMDGDGRWGYINVQGEWAIEAQFDLASEFRGDYAMAAVMPEDEAADIWESPCFGIIDRSGAWVLLPEYFIDMGYDGYYYGGRDTGIYVVWQDEADDDEEDWPLEGFFDIPSGCFSGLRWAIVGHWCTDSRLIPVYDPETYLYGYADRSTGEVVIPCQFGVEADPAQFYEGVAVVCYENEEDSNPADWPFLINERGEVIALPEGIHADSRYHASEGLIGVVSEDGLHGYADLQGNVVIAPQFRYVEEFHNGMALVTLEDGTKAYIDRAGNFLWDIDPEGPNYMENGLAWVYVGPDRPLYENEWQLIDRAGSVVSDMYQLADFASREFDEGLQPVYRLDGGALYLDETGAVALPGPYLSAEPFRDGLARVRIGDQEGYIDREGNEVFFWNRR